MADKLLQFLAKYQNPAVASFLFLIFWFFIWRYWDKKNKEPFWSIFIATIFGMTASSAILYFGKTEMYSFIKDNLHSGFLLILFLAALEEVLKLLGFFIGIKIYKKEVDQMVDGLVYGAQTALGFAFIENVVYFSTYEMTIPMVIFRSIDSMFAHTLFTGIFCFYYVIAYSPMKIHDRKIPIAHKHDFHIDDIIKDFFLALTFHITRRHVLPHRESKHMHRSSQVVFEGFWLAVILHFIHNIFATYTIFGQSLSFLIVSLLVLMAYFCFSMFKQKWYIEIAAKKREKIG